MPPRSPPPPPSVPAAEITMADGGAPQRCRRRQRRPSSDSDDSLYEVAISERARRKSRRGCGGNSDTVDGTPDGGAPDPHRRVTRSLSSKLNGGSAPERSRRRPRSRGSDDSSGSRETPVDGRTRPRRGGGGGGGPQRLEDLPESLLYSICQRLNIAEFAALAGTCASLRSFAAAHRREFMASQPPLLCSDDGSRLYDPVNGTVFRHRRLLSLMGRRNAQLLDICHGYLVVKCSTGRLSGPGKKRLLLLNLFTGDEVTDVPLLPEGNIGWVALTVPPTSQACVVVAFLKRRSDIQHGVVLYCRRGDAGWSMSGWYGSGKPIVAAGGRQLCALRWLRSGQRLLVSGHYRHLTQSSEVLTETPSLHCKHLVEVGDGLMFVEHWGKKAAAYWVGSAPEKMERARDVGDRAVVVSRGGASVSEGPARWGGEANCIYFTCGSPADYGIDALRLDRVDAGTVEVAPFLPPPPPVADPRGGDEDDPLNKYLWHSRSRAFWVVPSLCH